MAWDVTAMKWCKSSRWARSRVDGDGAAIRRGPFAPVLSFLGGIVRDSCGVGVQLPMTWLFGKFEPSDRSEDDAALAVLASWFKPLISFGYVQGAARRVLLAKVAISIFLPISSLKRRFAASEKDIPSPTLGSFFVALSIGIRDQVRRFGTVVLALTLRALH